MNLVIRCRLIVLALLSASATAGAVAIQPIEPVPTIEVTTAAEIAAVRSVHDALGAFSHRVGACVDAGRTSEICQCRYPQELAALRRRYDALVEQHPSWQDRVVSYQYVDEDKRNVSGTLVLSNLRRQLEVLRCE